MASIENKVEEGWIRLEKVRKRTEKYDNCEEGSGSPWS